MNRLKSIKLIFGIFIIIFMVLFWSNNSYGAADLNDILEVKIDKHDGKNYTIYVDFDTKKYLVERPSWSEAYNVNSLHVKTLKASIFADLEMGENDFMLFSISAYNKERGLDTITPSLGHVYVEVSGDKVTKVPKSYLEYVASFQDTNFNNVDRDTAFDIYNRGTAILEGESLPSTQASRVRNIRNSANNRLKSLGYTVKTDTSSMVTTLYDKNGEAVKSQKLQDLVEKYGITNEMKVTEPVQDKNQTIDEIMSSADNFLETGQKNADEVINNDALQSNMSKIYNILLAVGLVVVVLVGVILGIQFICASTEGKAEIKEKLVPYLCGVCIVFGAYGIWGVIINVLGDPVNANDFQPGELTNADKIKDLGNNIIGIIQFIGSFVAVIALVVIGIKYMLGSVDEKAEYKKTMKGYVIGAFLLLGITNFLAIIQNLVTGIF